MILNLKLLKKLLCLTLLSNFTTFKAMNSESKTVKTDLFSKSKQNNSTKVKTLSKLAQHKIIQYLLDKKNLDLKLLNIDSLEKLKQCIIKLNLTKLFENESQIVECIKIAQKNPKAIAFKDNQNIAIGYKTTAEDEKKTDQNLAHFKLYSLIEKKFIKEFTENLNITTLIISPNGRIALMGTFDGEIIFLDLKTNISKKILLQYSKSKCAQHDKCNIKTLDVTKDWKFAIAGGICWKIITLINLEQFKIEKEIDIGLENGILSGTINDDATFALLISFGSNKNPFSSRKIILWDIINNQIKEIALKININGYGQLISFDAEPQVAKFISPETVLIGLSNGILVFYNIHSHEVVKWINISKHSLHTIFLNPAYKVALIIDRKEKLFLLNLRDNQTKKLKSLNFNDEISGALSPDALSIAIVSKYQNEISIINLFNKELSNVYEKFNF